jgi:hypothetical protein
LLLLLFFFLFLLFSSSSSSCGASARFRAMDFPLPLFRDNRVRSRWGCRSHAQPPNLEAQGISVRPSWVAVQGSRLPSAYCFWPVGVNGVGLLLPFACYLTPGRSAWTYPRIIEDCMS